MHSDDIYVTQPVAFNIHDKSCTDLRIVEIKPYWIELNWKETSFEMSTFKVEVCKYKFKCRIL